MELMRAHRRIGRFAYVCVFAVALCAGCGGDSPPEERKAAQPDRTYQLEMRGVVSQLGETFATGFAFIEVESDEEAAQVAREMAVGFRRTSARAKSIQAPADVVAEHAAFIEALSNVAGDLEAYAESGGKDDTIPFDDDLLENLNGPLSAIQKKGYDLNWK